MLLSTVSKMFTTKFNHKFFWQGFGITKKVLIHFVNLKLQFMGTQKILAAPIAGIVAGAIIGMLTAPASGSETRQKLNSSADNLKRRFRRMTGKVEEGIDGLKATLKR